MLLRIAFLALALTACDPRDDDETPGYELDGVAVVLEDGAGPDETEMRLAVEQYRTQAALQLEISPADEIEMWRELAEIRWLSDTAAEGSYDTDSSKIRLAWLGCAAASELYPLLTEHYLWVSTGSTEHLESREWAEALARTTADILCE